MRQDSSNQARIFEAALKLFGEKGSESITISELAQQAGIARGTVYNNVPSFDALFEELATRLTKEMTSLISVEIQTIEDPAVRLSSGIKIYLKRAHEEPDWARFLIRFGMSHSSLKALWEGPMAEDLTRGIKTKRYSAKESQIPLLIAFAGCSVLGAMYLVREGIKPWTEASVEISELVLRALGIEAREAAMISKLQ